MAPSGLLKAEVVGRVGSSWWKKSDQPLGHGGAVGAALLRDLVADAVHDDAGMIAVAVDHVADIALRPLVEIFAVAVGHLGPAPHVERLIHDHEAHAVAVFQKLGRGRIVAGADGVHTGGFHDLQLALGGAAVDGRSQRAEVVMVADALDLDVPPVQEEALLLVEDNGANAERCAVAVHDFLVDVQDFAHQRVHVRMLDVPALGMVDGKLRVDGDGAARGDGGRVAVAADRLAGRVEDGGLENHAGVLAAAVAQLRLHRDGALVIGDFGRGDVGSPMAHVDRAGDIQPHVAIDSGAGIPARGALFGTELDHQDVLLPAEVQVRREVEGEPDVPIRTAAELLAVQPHARVGHGAIELDGKVAVFGGGGEGEPLAIPAGPGDGQRAGVRIELGIEGAFDGPIVRQLDLGPLGVLEIGTLRAGGFTLEEAPVVVQGEAAFAGNLDRGGGFGCAGKAGEQHEGGQDSACDGTGMGDKHVPYSNFATRRDTTGSAAAGNFRPAKLPPGSPAPFPGLRMKAWWHCITKSEIFAGRKDSRICVQPSANSHQLLCRAATRQTRTWMKHGLRSRAFESQWLAFPVPHHGAATAKS